jgi:hypothetical protein
MARYWLGPWEWDSTDASRPFWRAPLQSVGSIDLRSIPQCAGTVTPSGFGLFVTANAVNLGSSYDNLGTDPTQAWNSQSKIRWQSALGLPNALTGNNLRQILWETLTIQSDPTGDNRAKPLVPANGRRYEIWLAGQLTDSKAFSLSDAEATPLIDLLKRTYRQLRQDSLDGLHLNKLGQVDLAKYRKVLGYWVRQYAIDYRNFQPVDVPDETPLDPDTTITDDFNRDNNDPLGSSSEGWSWTETSGDTDIASNEAKTTSGGSRARAESDLSSADQYAQIKVTAYGSNRAGGTCVRYNSGADTCYLYALENSAGSTNRLFKCVTGSLTQVGSTVGETAPTPPFTVKLNISGSSLEGFRDGVSKVTATDSAITANLRTGLYGDLNVTQDDFQASDGLSATGNPWNYYAQC